MRTSLANKIAAGAVGVSIITYGCSAFFIFYLKDKIAAGMAAWGYQSIVLLLGVLWTGILGWLGARWLMKPLLRLTDAANEAAAGNLRVEIPVHAAEGEIRQLGLSFARMIDGLRQTIADISAHVSFARDHSGQLQDEMEREAQRNMQISSAAEMIAAGAAEQAAHSDGALAAVTEIRGAAAGMATRAQVSRRLARQMIEAAAESREIVRSLTEGMADLARSSKEATETVGRMREQARQIRGVSQWIGQIADQTQLLALNAAIEASRAGEAGQGFAIVAGEIRKLAEESATALQRIDRLIAGMEGGVASVVGQTAEQEQLAGREAVKGAAANAALDRIDGAVGETARAVEEIAAGIELQTGRTDEAQSTARQVGTVAGRIADDARQAAAAIQEQTAAIQELAALSVTLNRQADGLHDKIRYFRL